jgi:FkbM family methyltransferase
MTFLEFLYTVLLRPPPLRKITNRLICSALPATVTTQGATISINPNDPVISGALLLNVYESESIQFFQRHFSPGMTFVDVGANVGLYTALALSAGKPYGRILCVEPHEESRRYLEKTVALNTRGENPASFLTIAAVAVGASTGTVVLHSNSENKGDNRIYNDHILDSEKRVGLSTLDVLCSEAGISSIDLLKMDIQGAEFQAIKGGEKILRSSPDCLLMTEFWAYGIRRSGDDPLGFLSFLEELGFSTFGIVSGRLTKLDSSALLRETEGRAYKNIVCLKGRCKAIAGV